MAEPTGDRFERRKARTRAALISAAQRFIAAGNVNVPVLEITQAADVGLGTFYNHFESREELYEAAVEEVLEALGGLLDQLSDDVEDPAEVFAQSFRLFGRSHRRNPDMSKVFLSCGLTMLSSERGLAPRLRRDIEAGVRAGRFTVRDPELAVTIIAGAGLALGQFVHDNPERDDAEAADQITEDLLRLLGVPARQAQRIIRLPLPDLDAPHDRQDQAAAPAGPGRKGEGRSA